MLSKEEIVKAIMTDYYSDLAFIEELNNLTWGRKVQLKQERKSPNHPSYVSNE